jgi:transcriptional regulator with XRE-family HTH domain
MDREDGRGEAALIGGRLQAARQRAGASQLDVAQALGVTRPTISNWEAGRNQPSLLQFREMLTMYSAPAYTVLYGSHRVSLTRADRLELISMVERHGSIRLQGKVDVILGFLPIAEE